MDTHVKLPLVREFYANKQIFITGGTGYLGKVVIEKLLRSCPEVQRIFVLIRPKKGHSSDERLKLFAKDEVFDLIRKNNPEALEKIRSVAGDVRDPGLGISDADFERIRGCSIVIHSAATVRFDELLTNSILMNTRGTRETLMLAKRLDHVEIFNHVSTTFCNVDYPESEEKLYPVHEHWSNAIKLAENLDMDEWQALEKVYTEGHPNSYTFSKRLSEHLVNDLRQECNFPVVILRPSVVTPTIMEPFPGWVDNFNGPIGLAAAGSTGIYRFMNMEPETCLDFQPVDIVAKSIILSTWKQANARESLSGDLPIYNSSSFGKFKVTFKDIADLAVQYRYICPPLNIFWYPNPTFVTCQFYFVLLNVFCLVIPTNIIDFFLDLFKVKIGLRLSRLVRKIFYVQTSLQYFLNSSLLFDNRKCMALDKDLQPEEHSEFHQDVAVSKVEYVSLCFTEARWHLLREPVSTIPPARKKMRLFAIIHYSLMACLWMAVAYLGFLYLRKTMLYRAFV